MSSSVPTKRQAEEPLEDMSVDDNSKLENGNETLENDVKNEDRSIFSTFFETVGRIQGLIERETDNKSDADDLCDENFQNGMPDDQVQEDDEIHSLPPFPDDDFEFDDDEEDDEEAEWSSEYDRYNAEDRELEPDPPCIAFDPTYRHSYQKALDCLIDFPDNTDAAKVDHRLQGLLDNLKQARTMTEPKPIRIAFLGEAGKGKSSTMNSLLDKMNLTKTGATGSSCTNVVFEYVKPFSWQAEEPFAAEVIFYDQAGVEEIMNDLVSGYKTFTFNFDKTWDDEEHAKYRDKAKTAVLTLRAIFCDKDELATVADVKLYLRKLIRENKNMIDLTELVEWATEIISREAHSLSERPITASSALKLRTRLSPFTRTLKPAAVGERRPSLWYLVKVVKVAIRYSRVLEAFSPVDLPGIADRNSFRENRTNSELFNCEGCWIIGTCDRVCDNDTVRAALEKSFRLFPGSDVNTGNVALVCTKADENVDNDLFRSLRAAEAPRLDPPRVLGWRNELVFARKELKNVEKQLKPNSKRSNTRAENVQKDSLNTQKLELMSQIDNLEKLELNHLVSARCAHIERKAQRSFNDITPKRQILPVRCISNKGYANLKCEVTNNALDLEPQTTQIPRLRSLAMSMAAPRIQKAIETDFDKCLRFVDRAGAYLGSSPDDSQVNVIRKAQQSREIIGTMIEKLFEERTRIFETNVLVVMRTKDRQQDYINAALSEFQKWTPAIRNRRQSTSQWHSRTFMAFCRNNGDHKTKRQAPLRWNDHFLNSFRKDFDQQLKNFEQRYEERFENTKNDIIKLLEAIPEEFRSTHTAAKSLQNYVNVQCREIERTFNEEWARQKRVADVQRYICITDGDNSYFGRTMVDIYQRCREIGRDAATQRMIDAIELQLKRQDPESPFRAILNGIEKAFKGDAKKNKSIFARSIDPVFEQTIDCLKGTLERLSEEIKNDESVKKAQVDIEEWYVRAKPKLEVLDKEMVDTRYAFRSKNTFPSSEF